MWTLRNILCSLPLWLNLANAQPFIEREIRIHTKTSAPKGLLALLVRADEPGPHPLVILNHGAPRGGNGRSEMHPYSTWAQAVEFARRGWVAVVVMRRGYGDSGGSFAEGTGDCNHPDYIQAGENSAEDIREAIEILARLPEVDPYRIISVGVSAGGFATVALSENPPKGMVAGISFAGGRGSSGPDQVCSPDVEIAAFRKFGEHSRTPMLWVYATNDHFFGPQIAQRFYQAFTAAGGQAKFIAAPPFGGDGHGLFSKDGTPFWTPLVDDFLRGLRLMPHDPPLPFPLANIPPPPHVTGTGTQEFSNRYLQASPHKAWAVRSDGAWAWVSTRASAEQAEKDALQKCQQLGKPLPCMTYAVDSKLKR